MLHKLMGFSEALKFMSRHKFKQLRDNCIRMTHGLIFSFDSITCGKSILSNDLENQAFSFSVNGTAVDLVKLFSVMIPASYDCDLSVINCID